MELLPGGVALLVVPGRRPAEDLVNELTILLHDTVELLSQPGVLGLLGGRRLGPVRGLCGEIADEQVETAVAVPVGGADLGPDAPARFLGGIGPEDHLDRRDERLAGFEL